MFLNGAIEMLHEVEWAASVYSQPHDCCLL